MSNKLRSKGKLTHKTQPKFIYDYEVRGDKVHITWANGKEHSDFPLSKGNQYVNSGIWILKFEFKDYLKAIEDE